MGHDDPVDIPLQDNLQGPGQGSPVGCGQSLENGGLQAIETAAYPCDEPGEPGSGGIEVEGTFREDGGPAGCVAKGHFVKG